MRGMFRGPYYSWCLMSSDNKLVDYESAQQALDLVQNIIAEDGPFDGIMGFSQGAALALGLLLRYATDHPLDPAYAICKFAIFFSCVGINEEQNQWDDGNLLSIPSLHIFDKNDSMVAINMSTVACEPGSAKLILHERGHVIPRDKVTVNRILDGIQDLQHRAIVI
jgi:predicted esterase